MQKKPYESVGLLYLGVTLLKKDKKKPYESVGLLYR